MIQLAEAVLCLSSAIAFFPWAFFDHTSFYSPDLALPLRLVPSPHPRSSNPSVLSAPDSSRYASSVYLYGYLFLTWLCYMWLTSSPCCVSPCQGFYCDLYFICLRLPRAFFVNIPPLNLVLLSCPLGQRFEIFRRPSLGPLPAHRQLVFVLSTYGAG